MNRFALTLSLLLPLGGCSLLFVPDAPTPDAGIDGGIDTGMPDAPLDAPMDAPLDAPMDAGDGGFDGGPQVETMCADGIDNDGDGQFDCTDLDCAGSRDCCVDGTASSIVSMGGWGDGGFGALRDLGFSLTPNAMTGTWPTGTNAELTNFPRSDNGPTAIVQGCTPLAGGREFRMEFSISSGCEEECDDHAAFVLSPVPQMGARVGLFDELAVRVRADDAEVFVTQDKQPVGHAMPISGSAPFSIGVRIYPSVLEGESVLNARVLLRPDTASEVELYDGLLVPFDGLVRTGSGACAAVPGLYPAFEGLGTRVWVGSPVTDLEVSCANPSQFEVPVGDRALTADGLYGMSDSLAWTSAAEPHWAASGIGAPSLAESGSGWIVLGEGTNDQPELESSLRVGYSVSVASTTDWSETSWLSPEGPAAGFDPPSCIESGCSDEVSVREPFLFSQDGADLGVLVAEESAPQSETYAIQLLAGSSNPGAAWSDSRDELLSPREAELDECVSLRDPSSIEVDTGQYWLFFTCVPASGGRSLWAVHVRNDAPFWRRSSYTRLLGPEEVEFADDLFSAEPLLDLDPAAEGGADPRALLRVWFLARRNGGEIVVGLMTAETTRDSLRRPEDGPDAALPAFVPYEANPVLRPDDAVFLDRSDLVGLAVARDSDVGLRFLLARRVLDPMAPGRRRYEYTPLLQRWIPRF